MAGKKTLSIVAISYNEQEHLVHWYQNHKDLADEFILYDTGSKDSTKLTANALGVNFIDGVWHHDFAEAKNQAIKHATSDWVLMLSPDLWIDKENFEMIQKAIDNPDDKVAFYMPFLHHFKDWTGEDRDKNVSLKPEEYLSLGHIALIKNDPYIEYRHKVHENAHESIMERYGAPTIGFLPCTRHHDATNPEFKSSERTRYYWFLEDMGAVERKLWEQGAYLRGQAYDR